MMSLTRPIPALQLQVRPIAEALGLQTLSSHIHEILYAAVFYSVIFTIVAPFISKLIIPNRYRAFDFRTSLRWRIQCTSFVQSILICILALIVMFRDERRTTFTNPEERVWAYEGLAGSVQAFATGYFVWDLFLNLRYIRILGLAMTVHGFGCLSLYLLGFRPVFNYYGCIFVLFELSTIFLNIHLFLHQLGWSGSRVQLVNGIILILTFFGARIVWGLYFTAQWCSDVYHASSRIVTVATKPGVVDSSHKILMKEVQELPYWLIAACMVANIALNSLNVFWFGKMIMAIMRLGEKVSERKRH